MASSKRIRGDGKESPENSELKMAEVTKYAVKILSWPNSSAQVMVSMWRLDKDKKFEESYKGLLSLQDFPDHSKDTLELGKIFLYQSQGREYSICLPSEKEITPTQLEIMANTD